MIALPGVCGRREEIGERRLEIGEEPFFNAKTQRGKDAITQWDKRSPAWWGSRAFVCGGSWQIAVGVRKAADCGTLCHGKRLLGGLIGRPAGRVREVLPRVFPEQKRLIWLFGVWHKLPFGENAGDGRFQPGGTGKGGEVEQVENLSRDGAFGVPEYKG